MPIFFARDYKIYNYTGEYIDGEWVETREPLRIIQADAQPMTSREVEALNIGRRELGKIKIYTDETLNVLKEADDGGTNNGTYFEFDNGEWYEVILDNTYRANLISHNKYIAELRKNEEINKV